MSQANPTIGLNGWGQCLAIATIAAVLIVVPSRAKPQVSQSSQDAFHEVSNEAATCVAYYGFAKRCVEKNAGQERLASQLQGSMEMASKLQNMTGSAAGMTDKAMLAVLALMLKDTKASISNNCVNLAILIVKYADVCKSLLERPDERLSVLMAGPPKEAGR